MTSRFITVTSALAFMVLAACSPSLTEEELIARATDSIATGDLAAAELDVKTALQQNPESAGARSLYGQIYLRQINPAAAVDEFERALAAADSAEVRLWLAKALVQAGENAELCSEYEAGGYSNLDGSAEFQAVLARAYLSQKQYEEARSALALAEADESDYGEITRAVFALQLDQDAPAANALLKQVVARSPDNAHAWSLMGILATRDQNRAAAEEYFAKASAANPYRLGDRLQLVNTQIRLGKGEAANDDLEQLEKLIPNYPEVNFLRGQLYFDTGAYRNAIDAFSRVLTVNPNHPGALLLSANANVREDNHATAQRQYSQFLTLQPGHLEASLQLAEVWRLLGEPENTEALAREILKEYEMNVRAMVLLAAALSAQGMHAESAQTYEQIAALQPESVEAQVAAGSQLLVSGDTAAGLKQLESAVALNPENAEAHERLIEARLATNDIGGAVKAAVAYAEIAPADSRSSIYLGRVRLQQKQYDEARALFEKVLEQEPGNIAASGGLAALALLDQDLDGAKANFESALAANTGDLRTSMNLAVILEQTGDFERMRQVLDEAIEVNPNAVEPRVVLARYALSQNQPGEAIEWLKAVEESSAQDHRVHLVLTGAYLAAEQLDAAQSSARRLINIVPDDPNALALVARVDSVSGRPEQAQQKLEKALSIRPSSAELRKMLIETLTAQRKLSRAGEEISKLPEAAQNETPVLVLRGRLAMADGDAARAERLLAQAFEQQRNNINLALLASAQWVSGKRNEVISALSSWLEEFPDDALTRNELASRQLEMGNEATALKQYAILVEADPKNVLVLNNLAWLSRVVDTQQAMEYIERADRIAPDSGQIKDTYAMVMLEAGEIDRALALNNKAQEAIPDNAEIRYNRAQILARGGRNEEAADLLRELIAGPVFPSRDAARDLLDSL